jgi:prepilin-type N-terminal cleavage/methylation domain-containing protein
VRLLRRRLAVSRRGQAGYSLVEMVVVMSILGTVLAGVTTVFVSGSRAELNVNRRFQAQLQATAAFDRLRRDVHCASSTDATPGTQVGTITLTGCGSGNVVWRACGSGSRYALYRNGTTCTPTPDGKLYADFLTSPTPFTYTASVAATSLAKVRADLPVNVNPTKAADGFELADDIVLRNSLRG